MLNIPEPENDHDAMMAVLVCLCFYIQQRTRSAREMFQWCVDVLTSRSEYAKAVYTVLSLDSKR